MTAEKEVAAGAVHHFNIMCDTEQLTALFRKHDSTGSGVIKRQEVVEILRILDPQGWPDSKLDTLLKPFDKSEESKIKYEELAAWLMDGIAPIDAMASEEDLKTTINFGRSQGLCTLETPLLRMADPPSEPVSEAALLRSVSLAFDECTTEPPTPRPEDLPALEESPLEAIASEEELLNTIQMGRSKGPATLASALADISRQEELGDRLSGAEERQDGATKAALLHRTLSMGLHELPGDDDDDCPTEAPTRRPSEENLAALCPPDAVGDTS